MAMDYSEPKVLDHGDLFEITAMMQDGEQTDRAFPAGTPRGELTFS
jgi:hypothetical protein